MCSLEANVDADHIGYWRFLEAAAVTGGVRVMGVVRVDTSGLLARNRPQKTTGQVPPLTPESTPATPPAAGSG